VDGLYALNSLLFNIVSRQGYINTLSEMMKVTLNVQHLNLWAIHTFQTTIDMKTSNCSWTQFILAQEL